MNASIVIRTKNEEEFIGETLERVCKQEFGGKYEIIVVDSGSTDATLDVVKNHSVELLEIPEQEFSYGRSLNIGASRARGKFVVNLSAHAWPKNEKWLTHLTAAFQEQNVAGVYGKQISIGRLNPFEAFQNDLFFGQKKMIFTLPDKKNRHKFKNLHFSNSNSAIRKEIWERFAFNEEVPYAEDIWWQTEVMEAGLDLAYAPDAAVYHTHRISLSNTYRYSRDCAYTLALMKQKKQSVLLLLYDAGLLLGFVPISIFRNVTYMWLNNYFQHLLVAPLFIVAGWFGWLMGRTRHRLGKW